MIWPRIFLTGLLLSALWSPAPVLAETQPGRTSFGIRFGDDLAEGYLDFILPLVGSSSDLFFFNPRFGLGNEGANELNLGLGYRHSFGERGIVGGNFYFDSRRTRFDNRFSQVGVGAEYLSPWVDVRGNYYWPVDDSQLATTEVRDSVEVVNTENTTLTYVWGDPYAVGNEIRQDANVQVDTSLETKTIKTTKTFEDWESARQGFDAEIGLRVPLFGLDTARPTPALRLFAGYYQFEDKFDAKIAGPKGRLEFRALPFLTFDVELYEDKDLYGSRTIAGARLHSAFDVAALFHGKNPFPTAAATGMASRMNEMVMRDVRVQTDTRGIDENVNLRKIDVDTTIQQKTNYVRDQHIVLDDVVFVDGENGGDPGQNGTAELPFCQIQEGANNVFGIKNLYVYATAGNYVENVVLQDGTTMIGEGTGLIGRDGKIFGGGVYPVIASGINDPGPLSTGAVVTLASNTSVTGFTIGEGLFGIAGFDLSGAINITNNYVIGPHLANILVATSSDAAVNINGNYVEGGLVGIGLLNMGGQLCAQVNDNLATGNLISIGAANLGGIQATGFADFNPLTALGGEVFVTAPATTDLTAARNLIDASIVGIGVANLGQGTMNATLVGNGIYNSMIGMIGLNIGNTLTPVDVANQIAPPPAMTFTAANNVVANATTLRDKSIPGLLGIGVINAGGGFTEATIGGAGGGNIVDGYEIGIGVGGADSSKQDADATLYLPRQLGYLNASITGNIVANARGVGIGIGSVGGTEIAALIDGNTIEGNGIGVGVGTSFGGQRGLGLNTGLIFDKAPGADSATAARPLGALGALDVVVSNNRIVSNHLYGVGIFGDFGASMNVKLLGNDISGILGVYAWTEDFSHLELTLEEGNTIDALGPAVVLGARHESSIDFKAKDNTLTSSQGPGIVIESEGSSRIDAVLRRNTIASNDDSVFVLGRNESKIVLAAINNDIVSENGRGFVFKSRGDSVVKGRLERNTIDVADAEIRGHLYGKGKIDLTATDNVSADRKFAIRLVWDNTAKGKFLYSQSGNLDSGGGPAILTKNW